MFGDVMCLVAVEIVWELWAGYSRLCLFVTLLVCLIVENLDLDCGPVVFLFAIGLGGTLTIRYSPA